MIRDVLLRDFEDVSTSPEGVPAVETFHAEVPNVLVLGFSNLAESERQYLAIWRSATEGLHPHRALVLCRTADVRKAYALCKRAIFDDYVQYWPMSLDPMRLAMAVHHAGLALEIKHKHGSAVPAATIANETADLVRRTVLIVDDDPFQRSTIAVLLRGHGYKPMFASNGVEAIAVMRETKPDLVLLDVVMPEMGGAETIRRVKALPELADIPVLMMAGDSRGITVKETIEAGAGGFLVKPIVGSVLLEKLRRALRS